MQWLNHLSYPVLKYFLFKKPPEKAYTSAMSWFNFAYRHKITRQLTQAQIPHCPTEFMGLQFKNPVGLSAGFDKNAEYIDALGHIFGFGFIEVGTVTARPQTGTPQSQLFLLEEEQAIINRCGLNNIGIANCIRNLKQQRHYRAQGGIIGINIDKNATTSLEHAKDDYLQCLRLAYTEADYIAINISSQSSSEFQSIENSSLLKDLLDTLHTERETLANQHHRYVPIAIKISPDLDDHQIKNIAQIIQASHMDGIIACDTTTSKKTIPYHKLATEEGGLSGTACQALSNHVIEVLRETLGAHFPIIGTGGINSAQSALDKRSAGATLVSIYTGLIYQGPKLILDIVHAFKQK